MHIMYLHIGDGEEIRGSDLIGIFTEKVIQRDENRHFRAVNQIGDSGDIRSYIVLKDRIKTSIVASSSIAARTRSGT